MFAAPLNITPKRAFPFFTSAIVGLGSLFLTSCHCSSSRMACCEKPVTCLPTVSPTPPESSAPPAPVSESQFIVLNSQNRLPVVPLVQEGYYTCWSTCAEMITDFIGEGIRQCQQASLPNPATAAGIGLASCCDTDGKVVQHPDCDFPSYPDFERWGYACQVRPPHLPLNWTAIQNEIDSGRPFAFSWMRSDLSAAGAQVSHMLVVVGYSQSGGDDSRMLFCLNPRPFAPADEVVVFFSEYSNTGNPATPFANTAPPSYVHKSDYFDIRPAQGTSAAFNQ
jgi:hypothetical protein